MRAFHELQVGDVFLPQPDFPNSKSRQIVTYVQPRSQQTSPHEGLVNACPLQLTLRRDEYFDLARGRLVGFEDIVRIEGRWPLEEMLRSLRVYTLVTPYFRRFLDRNIAEFSERYTYPPVRLYPD